MCEGDHGKCEGERGGKQLHRRHGRRFQAAPKSRLFRYDSCCRTRPVLFSPIHESNAPARARKPSAQSKKKSIILTVHEDSHAQTENIIAIRQLKTFLPRSIACCLSTLGLDCHIDPPISRLRALSLALSYRVSLETQVDTPMEIAYLARHLKPSHTALDSVAEESDVGAGSKEEGVRVLPREQALLSGRSSAAPLHRSPLSPSERERASSPTESLAATHQRHHRFNCVLRSFSPAPSEPPGATLAPLASRCLQDAPQGHQ